ncbi:MAG: replication factor C large subunit [Candidatus Marsarchaeota archaeon]|nr:replication factor C large subunit [Candidatus Marsarchaeota archaeon]MCL5412807.1 replication factor C large subunit [Candidatus Marsarchaeota archaeon]
MSLCEKYTPFTINGILSNGLARKRMLDLGSEVLKGNRVRPVMICGPSGTGKTTAAHAFAYSNGLELIELNASDYRDAESLRTRVVPLGTTRSLFSKKCLILFDEIDELSSRADSGCESVILKLIRESRHPIIFIANDYWNRKVSFLRDNVEKIEFKRPDSAQIMGLMERILLSEKKTVDKAILQEIADRSNGDIRGALNDLDMMINASPDLMEFLGVRNRKVEIFKVLDRIFLSSDFEIARSALSSTDIALDMMLNWIGQNIPGKYLSKYCIYEAFDNLSRASMFNEMASRTSYYGYMRYSSVLMSSGVSLASNGNVSMLAQYAFPARISRMSKTKKGRDAISAIALKLSSYLHANKKTIINEHLVLFSAMVNIAIKSYGEDAVRDFMYSRYLLEKDEVAAISKYSRFSS